MPGPRAAGFLPGVGLLLLVACGQAPAAEPEPTLVPSPLDSAGTGGLVLQVEHVGGYTTPELMAGGLPVVSVYSDGRVLTQGPVPAIFPGPALPNVQEHEISPAEVDGLVDDALAAGVAERGDLGMPPVADVPSTRFTVVTDDQTYVREVYALSVGDPRDPAGPGAGGPDSGLTPEQEAARAKLRALFDELTSVDPQTTTRTYVPDAVAGIVSPWLPPADLPPEEARVWPGPPLPGERLGLLGTTCVTARNEAAEAVLAAAESATTVTPWTSDDGRRWSVTFRPLLPHEAGCAHLGRDVD